MMPLGCLVKRKTNSTSASKESSKEQIESRTADEAHASNMNNASSSATAASTVNKTDLKTAGLGLLGNYSSSDSEEGS